VKKQVRIMDNDGITSNIHSKKINKRLTLVLNSRNGCLIVTGSVDMAGDYLTRGRLSTDSTFRFSPAET